MTLRWLTREELRSIINTDDTKTNWSTIVWDTRNIFVRVYNEYTRTYQLRKLYKIKQLSIFVEPFENDNDVLRTPDGTRFWVEKVSRSQSKPTEEDDNQYNIDIRNIHVVTASEELRFYRWLSRTELVAMMNTYHQKVWRNKDLSTYNIYIRCKMNDTPQEYEVRKLTRIGNPFIDQFGDTFIAVEALEKVMIKQVSNRTPVKEDRNTYFNDIEKIQAVTADKLSSTILTSESQSNVMYPHLYIIHINIPPHFPRLIHLARSAMTRRVCPL